MEIVLENLSALGLVFNILGVILLWKFGLPNQNVRRDGGSFLSIGKNESSAEVANKYDSYSRIAIYLLVAGFIFQVVSIYL